MNAVFTPSRELREYIRARLDKLARGRPTFSNVEWWADDVFMVAVNKHGDAKRCARCDVLKPVNDFSTREKRNGKRFLSNLCKPCEAVRRKEWRHANPDREREHNRRYKAKLRARGAA